MRPYYGPLFSRTPRVEEMKDGSRIFPSSDGGLQYKELRMHGRNLHSPFRVLATGRDRSQSGFGSTPRNDLSRMEPGVDTQPTFPDFRMNANGSHLPNTRTHIDTLDTRS